MIDNDQGLLTAKNVDLKWVKMRAYNILVREPKFIIFSQSVTEIVSDFLILDILLHSRLKSKVVRSRAEDCATPVFSIFLRPLILRRRFSRHFHSRSFGKMSRRSVDELREISRCKE